MYPPWRTGREYLADLAQGVVGRRVWGGARAAELTQLFVTGSPWLQDGMPDVLSDHTAPLASYGALP